MGCGVTKKYKNPYNSNLRLELEKLAFNKRHEVIEKNLGIGIRDLDNVLKFGSSSLKQDIQNFIKNIVMKCDTCGLDIIEIKLAILEILSQEFIKEFLEYSDFDILNFAKENIDFLNFYNIPKLKDKIIGMINYSTRLISRIQKGIILKLEDNQMNDFINTTTVFNNLKFNNSFQFEILIIKINKFSIINNTICKLIGEFIPLQKSLNTLVIDIHDPKNKIMQDFVPNTDFITSQIKFIKDLKFFSLRNMNFKYKFKSTPTMEDGILSLLELDTLVGLCISKIFFSNSFLEKFGIIIEKLKNLKIIILEAYNDSVALDKLIKGILRNTSINVLALAGFNLELNKILEYKQIQKINNQLNYFEFSKEFNFNL